MGNNPIFPTTKGVLRKLGGDVKRGKAIFNIALTDGSNYDVVVTGKELTVGETYTVITESGSFSAVCKDFDGGSLLGNLASINPSGENTGESFVVYVGVEKGEAYGVAVDQNGGSFIKVITPETIVPIDPKYLPGVCLPVVELTTMPTEEGAALSESESAAVQAAFDTGMPCVIKCTIHEDSVAQKTSSVFQHAQLTFSDGELSMFARADAGYIHQVVLNDGTWVFRIDVLG